MTKKIKTPFVLDVSGWKGTIIWDAVHPCPDLVICMASSGTQKWDDQFPVHWINLKNLQIKRGAYHVFDPEADCTLQINNYFDAVQQAGGIDSDCIPPILDASNFQFDPKRVSLEKNIKQCLIEMEKWTGQTPIIHISRRYWRFLQDRRGNYPDWADDYLLWIPWYPSDPNIYKRPPKNTFPHSWENWAIWKYDDAAKIPGIKGYVSLSTLSESYAKHIGLILKNGSELESRRRGLKIDATIIASEGAIIRRKALIDSKMLAFLAKGSNLSGASVEFVNAHEAWLQVTKPISGWCPIVHTGRTYLSISK